MKAFIVDTEYDTIDEQTKIMLFGKLENGESFVSVHDFEPYFFVKSSDLKKIEKYLKNFIVEKTNLKDFKGNEVIKIKGKNTAEINKLYHAMHKLDAATYEADVKPVQRFLIDNEILSTFSIEGDYTSSERVNRIYHNPEIKSASFSPELKIVSIDTESDKSGKLFCIGIYSKNYKKCLVISDKKLENAINCKDEEDCLEKFKAEIQNIDPDIITGWNVIDFDLAYLQKVYQKNKIKFDIGRTNDSLRLRLESNYMKSSAASVQGRQVLDCLNLLQDPFIKEAPSIKFAEFESYSLEDVAQVILGKGKLIKGKNRCNEIEKIYHSDTQKLVDYNLLDCQLAYEILEKIKIIELAVERSNLTGIQLNKITASITAFDSLYIREARKNLLVSPTTRYTEKETKIIGGYVKLPEPGIHQNVIVLDFKSLYPSVLCTFNIDPASYLEKKEKNAIESPNKQYFRNSEGILPVIIKKLHEAREKAKKEKRELSSYAIKTIMNSFWGVLASPNCRYFNFDMASAITSFARYIIQGTAKKIEEKGYTVLYQDTDSCFVLSRENKQRAYSIGKEIQDYINKYYKEYVKEEYGRDSFLEIQFTKLYLSLMFPNIRQIKDEESKAAKKRYAGLVEVNGKEELEIVGLEAIRGDWTDAAKEFQRELILRLFHKKPLEQFISAYIKSIKDGKLDDKLIYRKTLRKNINEYTKTTPPHVKAARLLDSIDSNVIDYVITNEGPEPIQKRRHKLDYQHYIDKQITPIANQILSLLSTDMNEIVSKSKQAKLF